MSAEIDDKVESHSRGAVWTWLFWIGGALVLYVLSVGPMALLEVKGRFGKGSTSSVVEAFYSPLGWAYENTVLHKPLGIYMHFWLPKDFDKNGDN